MRIAALDIGGTYIKYCLYDTTVPFRANILKSFPSHAKQGGKAVVENAMKVLESLKPFDRIGIGTAGQVHPGTGEILFASDNIPNYTGTQLARLFTARFGVPTVVENDVNAAILAEAVFGAGQLDGFVIGLTYGTGIGGAIIHDGKLFHGSNYAAGEFGHIITHADGLPCTCGKKGCYEAYASTSALVRSAVAKFGRPVNGKKLVQDYQQPGVAPLIESWVKEVVYGLVTLVHIFNPHDVILGGGIMENKSILELVQTLLKQSVLPRYQHVNVKGTRLGNASGLRGAIYLAQTWNDRKG